MVKLNKIYTRTGDDGSTGLGTGERVSKDDLRVEAYGAVDEANSALGLAVLACDRDGQDALAGLLRSIQHDLFDTGADLCIPGKDDDGLRVQDAQVDRLESMIDDLNADLEPLTSFVLPGGTEAGAALHLARTAVRLAERRAVSLLHADPERTGPATVRFLNRLSDLLFVMARVANGKGTLDVLWKPGKNRS